MKMLISALSLALLASLPILGSSGAATAAAPRFDRLEQNSHAFYNGYPLQDWYNQRDSW